MKLHFKILECWMVPSPQLVTYEWIQMKYNIEFIVLTKRFTNISPVKRYEARGLASSLLQYYSKETLIIN